MDIYSKFGFAFLTHHVFAIGTILEITGYLILGHDILHNIVSG